MSLILIFIFSLGESYLNYRERQNDGGKARLLLSISDFLRSAFSGSKNGPELGILVENKLLNELPQFVKRLSREGVNAKVKIIDLQNNSLFVYPEGNTDFARSMAFPVIYETESKRISARMIVWVGESFGGK